MTPRCRKDMPRTPFVPFLLWLCWGTDNQDVHALLHAFHQELLSKCSVLTPVLPGCYYRLQDLILMLLWSEGEAIKLCPQQWCQDCKAKSRLGSKCGYLTLTAEVTSHLAWGWIWGLAAIHTAPYQGQNMPIPHSPHIHRPSSSYMSRVQLAMDK